MTSGKWAGSDRRSELPPDWPKRREAALKRDGYRCRQIIKRDGKFRRCPGVATDVDHVIPGDNHDLDNLRSLCAGHHALKSSREGVAARQKPSRTRQPERHPGERRR